ncbi:MAG: NADP-dependent oxidoreductase [Myxococcales bacterium]|nr:NADP-dependent oxidoreductase [Myxococcales bacterium]
MRAALFHAYGPADALTVQDVPDPVLTRPTDVHIAVHAAAINPIDWKIRAGSQRGALRLQLPYVGGLDVAGEVLQVGSDVSRFAVGDAVMGCPAWQRWGSYAEQCVVDEGLLTHKPAELTFEQAAALPLAGLTAWQCLLPRLAQQTGQRVLVQAGSGGVGHLAVQIAKHHGAWVATTCSERNHELVTSLGADQAIDYRSQRWWEELSDLDVVLDALGGEERTRALRAVKRGGRVASIVSGMPANTARYGPTLGVLATGLGIAGFWLQGRLRGVDASTVVKRTRPDQLAELAELVVQGAISVVIDRSFPLDEIAQAHAYGETGRIRGKVVIRCR